MIYSFKISENFFIYLQNKLSNKEAVLILTFFEELFLNRENLFYFDNRKLISDNKLAVGANSLIIKELQQLLSKNIKSIEKINNIETDILFVNENKKNTKQIFISIDQILNQRSKVTKLIKESTPNKWLPNEKLPKNQLKKEITSTLKRIFRYSDKIYIVDRYLPDHLVENNFMNIKSYENSFKFFADLSTNINSVEFYNGVKLKQLDKKKVKKDKLEDTLKKFYKIFKKYKSPVFVKSDENRNQAFQTMYERMFVTFLDDINIGIFTVEAGLNIINPDNLSTKGRKIVKQDRDWSEIKLEKWAEYVEKSDNFIFFETSGLN